MKQKAELVRDGFCKAEGDLTSAQRSRQAKQAWDLVWVHAPQMAETYPETYRIFWDIKVPFVHNQEMLVELCSERDPEFATLRPLELILPPYAAAQDERNLCIVQGRYFYPIFADWAPSLIDRGASPGSILAGEVRFEAVNCSGIIGSRSSSYVHIFCRGS